MYLYRHGCLPPGVFGKEIGYRKENLIFYRPQTKFAKVMILHVSVCPQGMGVSRPTPSGRLRGLAGRCLQAHTHGGGLGVWQGLGSPGPHPGGRVWGVWLEGVSRPTPGGGGVSQHALRQTPPADSRPLLEAVRILLECIYLTRRINAKHLELWFGFKSFKLLINHCDISKNIFYHLHFLSQTENDQMLWNKKEIGNDQ